MEDTKVLLGYVIDMVNEQKLKLDWVKLSQVIFGDEKNGRIHDMDQARWIVSNVIGKADIENSVLVYLRGSKESELARNLLRLVLSPDAMNYCKHVVDTPQRYRPIERQLAVELLRDIGDERILPWIDEFIMDDDPMVQIWAADGVMKLHYRGLIDEELLRKYFERFRSHKLGEVRRRAAEIKAVLLHEEMCIKRDLFLEAVEDGADLKVGSYKKEYLAACSKLAAFQEVWDALLPNDEVPSL